MLFNSCLNILASTCYISEVYDTERFQTAELTVKLTW